MKKNLSYEESLKQLEDTTKKLEKGELSLDESLKLYEEGVLLIRYCRNLLDKAEATVMALIKNTEEEMTQEPFQIKNGE